MEGRSCRGSGLTVEPSRRCGRWKCSFQELGSMVNNRSLRIHPDEVFEPTCVSARAGTPKRQGYAILSFQARNRRLQHHRPNAAPLHAFLIDADKILRSPNFLHPQVLSNRSLLIHARVGQGLTCPADTCRRSASHVQCRIGSLTVEMLLCSLYNNNRA